MHIPTGFLAVEIMAGTGIFSFSTLCYAVKMIWKKISRECLILFFIITLLVFILQMGDFPVMGSSGHVLGGAMAGIILGPWLGFLSMSLVITVQAVFFHDGGLLALGANIFNMAFIGAVGGYFLYHKLKDIIGPYPAAFATSWLYAVIASLAFVLETSVSMLPMVQVHTVIGLAEGLMTVVVLSSEGVVKEMIHNLEQQKNT